MINHKCTHFARKCCHNLIWKTIHRVYITFSIRILTEEEVLEIKSLKLSDVIRQVTSIEDNDIQVRHLKILLGNLKPICNSRRTISKCRLDLVIYTCVSSSLSQRQVFSHVKFIYSEKATKFRIYELYVRKKKYNYRICAWLAICELRKKIRTRTRARTLARVRCACESRFEMCVRCACVRGL